MMRRKTLPPDRTHDTLTCNIQHQCVFVTEFSNFLENCCYFHCSQMPVFRFVYYTQFKLLDNVIHV